MNVVLISVITFCIGSVAGYLFKVLLYKERRKVIVKEFEERQHFSNTEIASAFHGDKMEGFCNCGHKLGVTPTRTCNNCSKEVETIL